MISFKMLKLKTLEMQNSSEKKDTNLKPLLKSQTTILVKESSEKLIKKKL